MNKILLLFLLLFSQIFFSQQYIFGKVTTEQNQDLTDVTIINTRTDEKIFTDHMGNFMILAKNFDHLRFVKQKFDRITYKILPEDFNKSLKIILIKSAVEIKEVELKPKLTGNLKEDAKRIEPIRKTKLNKEISKYIAQKSSPEVLKPKAGEFVQPKGEGFSIGKIHNQWDRIDLSEHILQILGDDYFLDLGLKKAEIDAFINFVLRDFDAKNSLQYGYIKSSELLKFQQLAEKKLEDFKKLKQS